jgi:hypothetical protein
MKFAAEFYAHSKKLRDVAMKLAVISVTGENPTVELYLELE